MAASYASTNVRDDPATGCALYSRESPLMHEPIVRSGGTMLYADSVQQNGHVGVMVSPSHQQEILSGFAGFDFWRDSSGETLLMDPSSVFLNGQNLPGQGLSLSLGTRVPSGIQMPLTDSSNPILGLASFLSSNSGIDESTMISPPGFGSLGHERIMPKLRYLKAAQQLLNEVVNVRKALNCPPDVSNDENKTKILKESDVGDSKDNPAANVEESANSLGELSDEERQESQNKLSRLIPMLDEVDKRYSQYYHQIQIVKQSFDAMAGYGASKPYTVVALRRISHQFHCLRDAITSQIQATRKRLGEEDVDPATNISRLRYIDQQLRQQRAVHQLGMMQQHAWRPQRGLPESSVSALRAWLFEHFLHPYPKDSDKALLARQTGLTRGQVSNWFINARVRLWKPMVEEMYKDETSELQLELDSMSENATMASKSKDKRRDLRQAACSEECPVRELDAVVTEGRADFQERTHEDAKNTEHDASNFYSMIGLGSSTGRFRSAVSLSLGLQHHEGGHLPLPEAGHLGVVAVGLDSFYDTQLSSAAAETMAFDGKNTNPGDPQRTVASSDQPLHDFVA